jgi:hypothetical protein
MFNFATLGGGHRKENFGFVDKSIHKLCQFRSDTGPSDKISPRAYAFTRFVHAFTVFSIHGPPCHRILRAIEDEGSDIPIG